MSRTAQALKSAAWVMLQSWAVRLVSLIAFLALARLLKPEDFGVMALAGVYLTFCTFVIDQGFGTALVQREDLTPEHLDAAFWTQFLIGIAVAAVTFLAARPLAHFFAEPSLAPVLQALAPFPAITALTLVQQAQLRRRFQFKALAVRQVVSAAVGAALGIAMAWLGYGVWSLVGQMLAGAVIGLIILWGASQWRPRFAFRPAAFRDLAAFGASVFGHELVWTVANQVDRILLGRFAGAGPLGLYSVANRFVTIIGEVLVVGLQGLVVPVFARVQHDREALLRGLMKAFRLIAFITLPTFTGLALVAPELVPLLLGSQWTGAVPVAQACAAMVLIYALGFFLNNLLTAIGRPGLRLVLVTIQALSSLLFVYLALPYGPAAVALAMAASLLLTYAVNAEMLRRLIALDLLAYHGEALVPALASAAMAAAVITLGTLLQGQPAPIALVTKIAAGGLVYLTATAVLAPSRLREMLAMARLIRAPGLGLPGGAAGG